MTLTFCNDYDSTIALIYVVYQVRERPWHVRTLNATLKHFPSQLIVFFMVPALIIVTCYFFVIRELWKSTKNVTLLTNQQTPNP